MDGTYGNIFPANSPMSSKTPSSSGTDAYKVNVSRQKTKKWANFKPQNYDGDDWGDYDDGHEEPPPPPKPMGLRQPVPPPPHLRQLHPSGTPPLHISTQPAPGMADRGQSETSSPLRSAPAGFDSAATGPSVYSASPGFPHSGGSGPCSGSGTPLRRVSPAPPSAGAGAVPTRFPPRKSSMSQADAPDPTEFSQRSRSGSRPRATSPATSGAKSPVSPTKPLPFIRPADIYRRMDEEKERERRSVESGRPSLDSITGRGLDRVDSAPKVAESESADQRRPTSIGASVGAGASAGAEKDTEFTKSSRPSLAPVAERKSEYGLEGLLDSYASDPRASIAPAPSSPAAAQTLNTGAAASNQARAQTQTPTHTHTQTQQLASNLVHVPHSQAVEPRDELRRFSTSPKLPDLGRLSVFGDDLFSSSPSFSSTAPPLARIQHSPPPRSPSEQAPHVAASDETPPVTREEALSPSRVEKPAIPIIDQPLQTSNQGSSESGTASQLGKDAVLSESATIQEQVPTTVTMDGDHSNPVQSDSTIPEQNVFSGASQLASVSNAAENRATRPSLPGTWVTETPTTPGDPPVLDPAAESSEGSPTMETDAVNQNISNFSDAPPLKQQAANSQLNSPHALPPLRTGSPASSTSLQGAAGRPQAGRDGSTDLSPANNPETPDFAGSGPSPATAGNVDITPTAPLKPYHGPQESFSPEEPIVRPPSFDAGSTLDITGSSSIQENDILREEIMKSLSPVQSTPSGLPNITGQSTSAYQSAAGPVRESTYLADVYDDYWGAGEDRTEHQPDDMAPKESTSAAPVSDARKDVTSSPTTEAIADSQQLRQRFSWEAGSVENIKPLTGTQVEQKSLGPELHSVVVAAAAPSVPMAQQPAAVPTALDADHLAPSAPRSDPSPPSEQAPAGGISHQISQASTIPPRSALDPPIEPPSPVSVLSERVGPASKFRRLSLAEEKGGLQSSTNEVSQTPPLAEHPAMVTGEAAAQSSQQPQQQASASAPVQREVTLMPFRQIMDMPTAEERIRHFKETRMQFAAIDTGLDDWIGEMLKRHPEHRQPGFHFHPWSQNTIQTPHSQQQNPALSGDLAEGGLPTNNIHMPPPMHGSHNQVGTKSKELLLAAGKAGKGLLSKGKNKLRGTGDKESEPLSPLAAAPIKQSAYALVDNARGSETLGPAKASLTTFNKPKGDRRTSWGGFSLGLRSSRSDLAALSLSQKTATAGAPNLLSSGSGSAQQASAEPLSTRGAQPQRSQLQACYHPDQDPRPQFGPLLQKTSVASPALTFMPFPQPVTRSSPPLHSSPGEQSSPSPLPSPGTSVHHTKDNSIDHFIVQDRHRDGQPELVSPVSETFSNHPTPAPYERELGDNLRIPAPISKEQPSWDPFTGTPLVEEEDFDLEAEDDSEYTQNRDIHSIGAPFAITASTSNPSGTGAGRTPSAQAAHNPPPDRAWAEETSQERLDDIVVVPDNRIADKDLDNGHNATSNHNEAQLPLVNKAPAQQSIEALTQGDLDARPRSGHPDQMATYAQNSSAPALPPSNNFSQHPYNPHNAYLQHQGQNQAQSDPNSPHRQPSFVGLPPIRRESALLGDALLQFPSDEGSAAGNNGDNIAHQQQQTQNMFPPQMATQAQFVSLPPGQQPQVVQHVYRPSQIPMQNQYPPQGGQGVGGQGFPNPPPGAAHPQWTLRPQDQVPGQAPGQMNASFQGVGQAQVQQRSFSEPPVNSPPSMMANGPAQQTNTGQGPQTMTQGSRPMVPPPHMAAAHQRFSPQGGWTVQESHLAEPLHSPNRHRSSPSNASSHQPVYGFDKETGVPSTSGLDQGDRDEDQRPQPSGSGLQKQPQSSPFGQVSPASPPGKGVALASPTSTEAPDLPPPGPIPAADESRARRNSGVFSGLRERFTGISPDERQAQGSTAPRFQGVTGDEVSEASVVVTDENSQKKRGLFGGLRSSGHAFDNQAPRSKESIIAHRPETPVGERMQPAASPFPPPEKKKTGFFGLGGGHGHGGSSSNSALQSKLANSHTTRPSISSSSPPENLNPPAGSVGGPPRKRFSSAFKLHRSSPAPAQDGLKPPGTAQSSASTIQYQGQQQQPPQSSSGQQSGQGSTAPSSLMGRDRSGSNATTRPVTASPPMSNPNQQFSSAEQERAKKPSGGIFGRFMNRDSRHALGQPGQPVLNQGQMQMGRGQPQSAPGQPVLNQGQMQMGRGQPQYAPGQPQFAPGQPQFAPGQPQFMQGQPPFQGQGQPQPQYYVQRIGPDGKPMMQLVQFVQHPGQPGQPGFPGYTGQPGQPGQPGQMVFQPQHMQFMGNGQQFTAPLQGIQPQPNGQPGGQTQAPGPSGQPSQMQLQDNQNRASPPGVQQPPTPQQLSQGILGPVVQPGAGSPQVNSAVSQRSQSLASPPAEQSRSQSSSPVNIRHPVPVPPPGSLHVQAMQSQAPRPQPSTPTPPNQAFTRKPVQSSPKPPTDQLGPPPVSDRTQRGQRSPSISSPIPPPTGLQGSPSGGVSLVDQARGSSTPVPQPLPGTQAQRPSPQQSQSPQGGLGDRVPQPVPVPLPTPTPQPPAHGPQNMLHPPVQQSPLRPAAENQQRPEPTPGQGQGQGQPTVTRIPSHGSAAGPGPNQQPQTSGAAVAPPREQSTFSKLLKGAMPSPAGPGQDKAGKEKSKSGFMGAFRSRTKQPEGPFQPQQVQAQPSQPMQQGAGAPQIQQGQQQSQSLPPQRAGPQGQGQPGPQNGYQHQRQSPSISRSPDGSSAPQNAGPQQTVSPDQTLTQQPQPQPPQMQQGPTGLRQPGQQMPPPAAGRGGPQGSPQNQNRGPAEPEYAQVPIPRGYGYVHAEGGVAPAATPYFVGVPGGPGGQQQHRPSPGQFGPPGTPNHQQQAWARQNALERQIQPVPLPGQQFVAQRPEGSPAPLSQQNAPQPGGPQMQNVPVHPQGQSGAVVNPASIGQAGVARQQIPGQPTSIQPSFSQAANAPSAENSPHPSGLTPTPIGTPGGLSPVSTSPPLGQNQFQPRSEPSGPAPMVTSVSPPPQVQAQYMTSPQNYALPNTTFSPVNPAAAGVPNPPLPKGLGVNPGRYGMLQNNASLMPLRQVSAVSQISMQPDTSPSRGQNMVPPVSRAVSGQLAHESPSPPQFTPDRAVSPELQMRGVPPTSTIDSRTVSPEPPAQSLAPPPAVTTPRASIQAEEDNIYDATPRQSFIPRNQQVQNSIASQVIVAPSEATEPKPAGPSRKVVMPAVQSPQQQQHIVVETQQQQQQPLAPQPVSEPSSPVIPPATIAAVPSSSTNGNGNGNVSANPQVNGGGKPVTSSADIFNEEKRKMLVREQEEKIPVFPEEPDMNFAAAAAAKKKEQEELPHMTATSYPGQEWNPYGEGGGYEEWD